MGFLEPPPKDDGLDEEGREDTGLTRGRTGAIFPNVPRTGPDAGPHQETRDEDRALPARPILRPGEIAVFVLKMRSLNFMRAAFLNLPWSSRPGFAARSMKLKRAERKPLR